MSDDILINMTTLKWCLFIFAICFVLTESRIHRLTVQDDDRNYIRLTSFGFYERGYLQINFTDFKYNVLSSVLKPITPVFGFTLEKMRNSTERVKEECPFDKETSRIQDKWNITFFSLDLTNMKLLLNCSAESSMAGLHFYSNMPSRVVLLNNGLPDDDESHDLQNVDIPVGASCANNVQFPITGNSSTGYRIQLVVYIPTADEAGLYKFFFHSCNNYGESALVQSSFVADIVEFNDGHNYLSAGEMPLPTLYYEMSALFLPWAVFWIFILVKSRYPVYKIHYLMAAVMILKFFGLLFHGINYHYIGTRGKHVATWAFLYYMIHLLRGSLFFVTVILIGTGWTIIKHFLSPKDKKIFMIVIPLQVFANLAEIIIEESEEGNAELKTWLSLFFIVDLICCFSVIFPIRWSIKHLEDASQTDGKAAVNLRKLKLFRQFYLLVICYIYFTRMIVFLLNMTAPFQYEWLTKLFKEIVTFVFFISTGYKFQPASENPYLHVPQESLDDETDIVISKCGLTEGLTKLSRINNEFGDDDKDSLLIYKRESSYDYD